MSMGLARLNQAFHLVITEFLHTVSLADLYVPSSQFTV